MNIPFADQQPMPPWRAKANGSGRSTTEKKLEVKITTNEREVADQALAALAKKGIIYQRGGLLMHVVRGRRREPGIRRPYAPRISRLQLPLLRELLSDATTFLHLSKNTGQWEHAHVPMFVVKAIDAREQWANVPILDVLVEHPVLLPNGTILDAPGYSDGILYAPNADYPRIPPSPTLEDARAAALELKSIVSDFPFEAAEHVSVWLAAVLTAFVMFAIDDCVPLFVIDASVRGAGKTLLADLVALIATGCLVARMTHTRNEEEERKRITSLAMSGDNIVLIDNVLGELGGQSLDAALTGKEWRDRALGGNRMVNLPLDIMWMATGNNIVLAGDTPRRALYLRLVPQTDRPEERADFRHQNLRSYVKKHRARLVVAALTILRGYVVAGMPDQHLPAWGSFEEWSRWVRGALVWAGEPDPYANRDGLQIMADRDAELLAQLIAGFEGAVGRGKATAAELLELLQRNDRHARLRAVVREMTGTPPNLLPDARTLGNVLRRYRGRYIDGRAIERAPGRASDGAVWTIVRAAPPPSGVSAAPSASGSGPDERPDPPRDPAASDARDTGDTPGSPAGHDARVKERL